MIDLFVEAGGLEVFVAVDAATAVAAAAAGTSSPSSTVANFPFFVVDLADDVPLVVVVDFAGVTVSVASVADRFLPRVEPDCDGVAGEPSGSCKVDVVDDCMERGVGVVLRECVRVVGGDEKGGDTNGGGDGSKANDEGETEEMGDEDEGFEKGKRGEDRPPNAAGANNADGGAILANDNRICEAAAVVAADER